MYALVYTCIYAYIRIYVYRYISTYMYVYKVREYTCTRYVLYLHIRHIVHNPGDSADIQSHECFLGPCWDWLQARLFCSRSS